MSSLTKDCLSEHDRQVLESILNPSQIGGEEYLLQEEEKHLDDPQEALADIEQALRLSNNAGRTGCRALCQRGILKRKNNDIDGAREDFEIAAKLGSKFARTQLIELNPFAALCNQMLREVMRSSKD
uniref:Tetratricopeptide repeat protein 36 n=1 Tax=Anopheles farauti TaxID=69004 RepID=A0A182PZE3_9DIPT